MYVASLQEVTSTTHSAQPGDRASWLTVAGPSPRTVLVAGAQVTADQLALSLSRSDGAFQVVRVGTLAATVEALRAKPHAAVLASLSLPDADAQVIANSVLGAAGPAAVLLLGEDVQRAVAHAAVEQGVQDFLDVRATRPQNWAHAIEIAIQRKRAEAHLVYLAHYDQLTGLANRTLFTERLAHALSISKRARDRVGLLFIDLDNFKEINDTLGHDAGDQLLKQVAIRLRATARDCETVARLAGDEFTIVLEIIKRVDDAATVARRVQKVMAEPFLLNGMRRTVSATIGLAISSENAETVESLLERADGAMYRAKRAGRGTFEMDIDEPDITTGDLFDIGCEVERAFKQNELALVYQPKVHTKTGRVAGVEALLRWNHPRRGLLKPAEFVPRLEESGLIVQVGEWVIREACRQTRRWIDAGLSDICVAVNISARQFEQPTLTTVIQEALAAVDLPGRHLEVEITESLLMESSERSVGALDELKSLGVRIALDDFGSGYSSLRYLIDFPIDVLKVDRAFASDLARSPRHCAVVKAMIGLGASLGIETVVEGVETSDQLALLCDLGCQVVQGYLMSPPRLSSDLTPWLRAHASGITTE